MSIHIRRGDYLQSPKHLNLSLSYYQKAIQLIKNSVYNPHFFIFSDDIQWAKENIRGQNIYFVQQNKKEQAYRDMQLMSLCKHNIIANSTFSWWAAWLNNYNKKIVIAPSVWFKPHVNTDGLLLPEWITIEDK